MDTQELLTRESRTTIETWARRNAQSVYLGDSVLCRVLGKYLMHVSPKDRSLAPHLMLDGYWEMWITMAIARYIKPGMHCIDVGANVGYYSVLLSDWVGGQGFVWAIEPEERNYELLEINLEKLANVQRRNVAASDHSGEARLFTHRAMSGNHTLESASSAGFAYTSTVNAVPLDDIIHNAPVDFIKLDVEGHERAVWRGMRHVLSRSPNVQIAAEWAHHSDPEAEIVEMAQQDGFQLHEVHTDGTLRAITVEDVRKGPDWRMLWFKR